MRPKTIDILTPQEWRVVESVASGWTIKEIADHLTKSTNTVVNQLQSVYAKVNIPHNLNALAVWYMCRVHNIDLPDFIRKCGATMMLMLFLSTINNHSDLRRARRIRVRRNETELIN